MRASLLFDTSVWIDFLNKNDTPQARLLEEYIEADNEVFLKSTQEIVRNPPYPSGSNLNRKQKNRDYRSFVLSLAESEGLELAS